MKLRNPAALRALTKPGPSQVISVTDLAMRSRVSSGFIYHLMNGRKEATPAVAHRISKVIHEEFVETLFIEGGEGQ